MPAGNLDAGYWQNRYDSGTDAWDLGAPSTPLAAYIDQLIDKELRILIPGCGSAWEGQYLHERGFRNTWLMDLTGRPFKGFLERCPDFPQDHLLIGDFFAHKGQYDRIIEQTFFCAIDPSLRERYAEKMRELLAPAGKLVGVLFDDPQPGKEPGAPPFGGSVAEYVALFTRYFGQVKVVPCYNSIAPRSGREAWINVTK